ncbi:quaternary amine ABC transporter ATP-binding protein [Salinispira pacifica]|uniref:Glycine betaine ABC transport system, ATP-binding protein OpuAA n=1 Tax=Salinispira pacifica TaxID=1307761 RepID=V5WLH6_9SPIO|nr:glycine betaine/L-proline ABC transporter ATP-binding protein [Salinispira pacifica]AHC16767.1 Glycine betaine ABC transport system, ATP-binding protein OpuAA [Salinispira pacifica]
MSLVEVKDLYKIFGPNPKRAIPLIKDGMSKTDIKKKTGCTIAINGATFSIDKKETFVVMGLSGSGKSTFIRCLNKLIKPTAGAILVDGKDIMQMDSEELQELRRRKMSMVFQNFGLLPHRNVVNNVEFGLEVSGVDKETRRQKALDAIKLVGLDGFEFSMPRELSGGMQQRVGLARALANDPEILLMDEAFSALDPLIRTQMQDELLELQAKMHKTIIFITHDLDEALKLGDRIAILGPDGRVRQIGTPEQILSDPADDYVKKFVQNVDRTKVITASSVKHGCPTLNIQKDGPEAALRLMEKEHISHAFVVDSERVLQGIVSVEDAVELKKQKKKDLTEILTHNVYTAGPETAVSDLLATALESRFPIAVIGDDNKFHGIVDRAAIIAEVTNDDEEAETPTVLSEVMEQAEHDAEAGQE